MGNAEGIREYVGNYTMAKSKIETRYTIEGWMGKDRVIYEQITSSEMEQILNYLDNVLRK